MNFTRVTKKYVEVPVTAALADGTPATLAGVDVTLLTPRTTPDEDTTWTPATYGDGVARILLAGPDADPAGAVVVPASGADLWVRVVDNPEVDAARIERLTVQ